MSLSFGIWCCWIYRWFLYLCLFFYLFICSSVVDDFNWVWCFSKPQVLLSQLCSEAVLRLSIHQTLFETPNWFQARHIRPCLAEPKRKAATLDSLSYYLGCCPAMPLTLCHVAYYKPWGNRGAACLYPKCLCVHVDVCFPAGLWKHFVHLLMLCLGLFSLHPRTSHFYLLSPLTAEGMMASL